MADFQQLKEQVSIEEAAQWLGLQLTKKGFQFRAPCPACQSGGDRAIVITPEKQLFYCFSQGIGGDLVTLVGHIKKVSLAEAGQQIAAAFGVGNSRTSEPVTSRTVPTSSPSPSFDPEKFAKHLTYTEEVAALGFSQEDAERLGVGFHSQRKLVYLPLRNLDGGVAGFIGVPLGTALRLPPQWLQSKVVALRRA